jgi:hypothetical protein
MKPRMKTLLIETFSAIAVSFLALSFTLGASSPVRADDLQAARPDMILVSATALEGLEQRVSYLEALVASLTESSQHINTHQLCVSDDSGAETCLTKAQLDALLTSPEPTVKGAQAAPPSAEGLEPAKEDAVTTTAGNAEPAAPAVSNESSKTEPESTAAAPAVQASEVPGSQTAPPSAEGLEPAKEDAVTTTAGNAEPAAPAISDESSKTEPESTGSISTAAAPAAKAGEVVPNP